MPYPDIALQRLSQQGLSRPAFASPAEVVSWFGAVQAQDYLAAMWALGLRVPGATERDVEAVVADRRIIRTWALRGTLHFLAPPDTRWLLALIRPSVVTRHAPYNRRLEIDETTFGRSAEVLAGALAGGRQFTRPELARALEANGIGTHDLRMTFLLYRAALDGLICLGARRGKQYTYTLLDEWAPGPGSMGHDEALAELARRYFTAHGPATVGDFTWWSGLPAGEARRGLELVSTEFVREEMGGRDYWHSPEAPAAARPSGAAYLLPNYDEMIVGYRDRSASIGAKDIKTANPQDNVVFSPAIMIDGRVVGNWKRTFRGDSVLVEARPFRELTAAQADAFTAAARRYGEFLGMPVLLA